MTSIATGAAVADHPLRRVAVLWLAAGAMAIPSVFFPFAEGVFAVPKTVALLLVVAGTAALPWWRRGVGKEQVARSLRAGWPAAAMLGVACVSYVAAGPDLQGFLGEAEQLQGVATLALYVTTSFLGSLLLTRSEDRWRVAEGIAVGSAGVAVYALVQTAGLDPIWPTMMGGRATSSIGQPNAMAALLAMSVPFPMALAYRAWRFGAPVIATGWVIVTVAVVAAMVAGGSRGAVLGLTVGLASTSVVFVQTRPIRLPGRRRGGMSRRGVVLAAVVASGLAVALAIVVGGRAREAITGAAARAVVGDDRYAGESTRQHLELWAIGLRMAVDHPVLGVGPERFPLEFPSYRERYLDPPRRVVYRPFRVESPHSVYVAWAAGIGIPGALLYVWLIVAALIAAVRAVRRAHADALEIAMMLSMTCALVIHAVTDAFMTAEVSSSWIFWLLMGAALRTGSAAAPGTSLRADENAHVP